MNAPKAPPATDSDLQCLTVKDVAGLLRCSPRAVWRESALGSVGLSRFPRPLRMGSKRTRWLRKDVAHYLAALAAGERRL